MKAGVKGGCLALLKVGLTGGIACGKSTVAKMLKDKGAFLIDADQVAREVVEPEQPAFQEIVQWLGEGVVAEDGSLDRQELAQIVFQDQKALSTLNSIVHSRVIQLFEERSNYILQKHPGAIQVWDVPLLIEAGMQDAVDITVVVVSSEENQLLRLSQRDGLKKNNAIDRVQSQLPMDQKIAVADYVLYNNSTLDDLQAQVDLLWRQLLLLQEQV